MKFIIRTAWAESVLGNTDWRSFGCHKNGAGWLSTQMYSHASINESWSQSSPYAFCSSMKNEIHS